MDPKDEQAPTGDTPDAETKVEAVEPAIDWQKRYEDLRPEYDRTTQRASQYEQLVNALRDGDPDTRAEAARLLDLEFVTEENDGSFEDPSDEALTRVAALEAQLAAQRDEQQSQAHLAHVETAVETQLDSIDGLDEGDKDWIVSRAISMPPTSDGLPDIQAAHQELVARDEARLKQWAATKRAPSFSPGGQAGTQTPNLDNEAERVAWMTQRLAESQ